MSDDPQPAAPAAETPPVAPPPPAPPAVRKTVLLLEPAFGLPSGKIVDAPEARLAEASVAYRPVDDGDLAVFSDAPIVID